VGNNLRIAIVVLAFGATAINGFVAWQSWNDVQSTNAIAKAALEVDARQVSRDSTTSLSAMHKMTRESVRAVPSDFVALNEAGFAYERVDADLKRQMSDFSQVKTWAAINQPTDLIISETAIVVLALVALALARRNSQ
jgi:predicted negative regulator of RcsB-dependent stress response